MVTQPEIEADQVRLLSQAVLKLKAEVYDARAELAEKDRRYLQLLAAIFQVIGYVPGPNGQINSDEVVQTLKARVMQSDLA